MMHTYMNLTESGLRLGTVLSLKYKNIQHDFEKDICPCRVVVPREITKRKSHDYYSFIHTNTIAYLTEYFRKRRAGTDRISPEEITSESLLFRANTTEIKPVMKASVDNTFREALLKLGIIKDNGKGAFKEIRPHTLRKYFRTYMNPAGFTWVHFFMGHVLKTNDDIYFHAPEVIGEARKAYKNTYDNLDWTRKTETKRLNGLQKKIVSQSVRIKSLERTLERYKTKNKEDLQSEIYQKDSELSALQQHLNELEKRVVEQDAVIRLFDDLLEGDPQFLKKFRERFTKKTKEQQTKQ